MSASTDRTETSAAEQGQLPEPRRVPFDAPWEWLAAGWRDIAAAPCVSLGYGAVFAVAAGLLCLLLLRLGAASLFLALAGGFLLLGPFLAVGLYSTSRRLAEGREVRLSDVAWAWTDSPGQLGFFGAVLLFIYMVWVEIALLLLMLFLGNAVPPHPSEFMHALLFTPRGLGLLIVGTIVGGALAATTYIVSALSVPMLLEQKLDVVTASQASIMAISRNWKPMALWAGLIVVMMAAGFATLLLGLVVAFPLIGHATWHAYNEIYGDVPKHRPDTDA